MGYSFNSIEKILQEKTLFAGKKILTLGTLYPFLSKAQEQRLAPRGLRFDQPKEKFSQHLFVEKLGAQCCHSLDVSDYQGSDIICNLNLPIPSQHANSYDVVIDAGTLEHLSNLPVALGNIFSLLRTGGIYYFGVPCNNWVDHGFFQFSPTFFRDLCIDNPGLELRELYIGTIQRYYDYARQNPVFVRALLTSRQRLNVGGIICKTGEGVDLDLTQSKYRPQYAPQPQRGGQAQGAGTVSWAAGGRRVATSAVQALATSPWIPLRVKEVVLNGLYRVARGNPGRHDASGARS